MHKLKQIKKLAGITLIELMLYIAIFGALFTSVTYLYITISQGNSMTEDSLEINKNIIFVTEHLNQTFSDVVSISSGGSTFDNDNGVLLVNNGTTNLTYQINNQHLQYNDGSQNYYLNTELLTIDRFYLQRIEDSASNLIGVKVTFRLTSKINGMTQDYEASYYQI